MTGLRNSLMAALVALTAAGLFASTSLAAPTEPEGEFHWPSPSQVPAPTPYNTAPACPPTSPAYDCEESTLPPADANNPERYINSAYWPAEERPDIEMYAVMQYGYEYKDCAAILPHLCFLVDAEAVGYPVSHTPQVGDLWLAPCDDLIWESGTRCGASEGYYLGYVQEVLADGSFIQSWGGSDTSEDSGLAVSWLSAATDPNADFIGFFPPGQFPHLAGSKCYYDICPASTEAPMLSPQEPHQGQAISVSDGTWSGMAPITYSYQWQLCDPSGDVGSCAPIPGATGATYTPTAADVGRVVAAVVTGTNEVDSVAATPAESSLVLAPGPRIEGLRVSSFLQRRRGRAKAGRSLRVSWTQSARGMVRLSISHEMSKYVKTAHGRHRRTVPELVLDMDLNGHTGLNVRVMPDRFPRGTDCAMLTASAQGISNSAEACFMGA
jgi:hypothetical protein